MKDEIKDLLQYLKNVYESEETSTWLNKLQIKDLLDYITNLQTIEQHYSQVLSENAELQQKYDMVLEDNVKESKRRMELQEENERLKKLIITLQKNIMELDCSDEELELLNSILQGKSDE